MQKVYTKFILAQIRKVHEPISIFQSYSWLRRFSLQHSNVAKYFLRSIFNVTNIERMYCTMHMY
jgi:hypothetical protein